MRQGLFFNLFGEIYVRQGGDLKFISKSPDEAWGVFILWLQIVNEGGDTDLMYIFVGLSILITDFKLHMLVANFGQTTPRTLLKFFLPTRTGWPWDLKTLMGAWDTW